MSYIYIFFENLCSPLRIYEIFLPRPSQNFCHIFFRKTSYFIQLSNLFRKHGNRYFPIKKRNYKRYESLFS